MARATSKRRIDAQQQLRRRRRIRRRHQRARELLLDSPRQWPQPYRLAEDLEHGAEVRYELRPLEVGRAPPVARFQKPDRIGEQPAERVPVEVGAQVIGLEDRRVGGKVPQRDHAEELQQQERAGDVADSRDDVMTPLSRGRNSLLMCVLSR